MDRTWKVYGILVFLGWLLFGGLTHTIDSGSASGPAVQAVSVSSIQFADSALYDGTPPLDQQLHRVAKEPPQQAKNLVEAIRQHQGEPLPGYIGGGVFQNRERRLPSGRYREYDVNPKIPGRSRGAERIVIEQRTGKAYYTHDHYRTFVPMN